jgi:phosphatidylinositol alpha-1,6-mannosyltransferase
MIVIATQCYPPRTGGIENLLYGVSATLFSQGHELIVFADSHNNTAEAMTFDGNQGFNIKRYSGVKFLRRRKKAHDINLFIKNNRPMGVICDSWKSLEYLRTDGVPAVLCLAHGTELPVQCSPAKSNRIESSLTKATAVIANSVYTAGRTKPFLANPEHLHVINPGIHQPAVADKNTMARIGAQLGQHSPILISVARLQKRKGLNRIIQLLPKLLPKYPELFYVIIGEGSEHATLQKLVQKLKLENHVMFAGAASETELSAYLDHSQLFLMPGNADGNDVEGFGIAYIEAAYHGIPAIAGRSGGATEAVIDEQTGLLCSAGDEQSFFAAVTRLLGDETLLNRMGENAQQRAQNLLWTKVIGDYEKLLGL